MNVEKGDGLYFGGVPTDIEVRRLREHYGIPEIGVLMPYEEVEGIIKCEKGEPRFQTVTNRWRKQLERDENVVIGTERGKGFIALDPSERVDLGGAKLRSGMKSIRRGGRVVAATDQSDLSDEQKRKADHVNHITSALIGTARIEAKKLRSRLPAPVGSSK